MTAVAYDNNDREIGRSELKSATGAEKFSVKPEDTKAAAWGRGNGAARTILTISDAYEGVEVFVNGISAGVQVVPTYRFDISGLVKEGDNVIAIEVSTTLERERAAAKNRAMVEKLMQNKVLAPTGITGVVKIYEENKMVK